MDNRIAFVIARIEETLATDTDVADLAAAAGLSPSRFAHLFRAETGVSPGRYLQTLRMQRARVLLERTFLSVKEVMARVGFRDPSHFARDFRRFHGVPPSALRGAAAGPGPTPAALLDHLMAAHPHGAAHSHPTADERPGAGDHAHSREVPHNEEPPEKA